MSSAFSAGNLTLSLTGHTHLIQLPGGTQPYGDSFGATLAYETIIGCGGAPLDAGPAYGYAVATRRASDGADRRPGLQVGEQLGQPDRPQRRRHQLPVRRERQRHVEREHDAAVSDAREVESWRPPARAAVARRAAAVAACSHVRRPCGAGAHRPRADCAARAARPARDGAGRRSTPSSKARSCGRPTPATPATSVDGAGQRHGAVQRGQARWGDGKLYLMLYAGDPRSRGNGARARRRRRAATTRFTGVRRRPARSAWSRSRCWARWPTRSARGSAAARTCDRGWQSRAAVAVDRDGTLNKVGDNDEEWVVEMAMPFEALGVAKPGAGLRLPFSIRRCEVARAGKRGCGGWGADPPGQLVLD